MKDGNSLCRIEIDKYDVKLECILDFLSSLLPP